ncbi:unnamed protein product [Choristocarpus tenellus]
MYDDDTLGGSAFADLFELTRELLKTDTYVLREAHQRSSPSTKCLVKCLFTFGLSKTDRKEMEKELQLYQTLKHDRIVMLEEIVAESEDRFCYILYEDMPGGTLADHLGRGQQYSEEEVKVMVKG